MANIVLAVREVVPPMMLTSLVVVVAFVPLAFVTGLMGPYMAPMALTVPVAMLASTAVAALIVPWLAQCVRERFVLRSGNATKSSGANRLRSAETGRYRVNRRIVQPVLITRCGSPGLGEHRRRRPAVSRCGIHAAARADSAEAAALRQRGEAAVHRGYARGLDPGAAPQR